VFYSFLFFGNSDAIYGLFQDLRVSIKKAAIVIKPYYFNIPLFPICNQEATSHDSVHLYSIFNPHLSILKLYWFCFMGETYRVYDQEGVYFVTFTVHQACQAKGMGVDVFSRADYVEILLANLRYCQTNKG